MSPNISGIPEIDIPKSINLGCAALNICKKILIKDGIFLVKIFQSKNFNDFLKEVGSLFKIVKIRKPKASRKQSREIYIIAKGYYNIQY